MAGIVVCEYEIRVNRFTVWITNGSSAAWLGLTVHLNGGPPWGYLYEHGRPVPAGETVEIPVPKFSAGREFAQPSMVEPETIHLVVNGRETVSSFYPPGKISEKARPVRHLDGSSAAEPY